MKMSVVGCEASGKTVFLSALADYYNGDGRPSLVPENESANLFQRFQLRQMRSLRQWPSATDPSKTIELKWTLRQNGETLSEIDLLEFGGETFREAFRGRTGSSEHQEAVDILKNHLSASGFVVVLVSLRDLLRDPGKLSQEEFERDTESVWITRGLLEFLREQVPSAKVVIGLTQADLHRGEIAAAGGAAGLFRQRWPSIAAVAHDAPVVPVASVSATDENGNPALGYSTDGILTVMNEFFRLSEPEETAKKEKQTSIRNRTGVLPVVLLVLILAAAVAILIDHGVHYTGDTEGKKTSAPAITKTNVVEKTVTTTNVIEQTVVKTNVIEQTVVKTNVIEQTVTNTNVTERNIRQTDDTARENGVLTMTTEDFRIWHDHRGTPIKAKWIFTLEDRKRIVIETPNGKNYRASLRKLSADDQLYVSERLDAITNAENSVSRQSTDPTL